MNFLEALKEYHNGKWIRRSRWKKDKPRGANNNDKWGGYKHIFFYSPFHGYENESDYLGMVPEWDDLLADDWIAENVDDENDEICQN